MKHFATVFSLIALIAFVPARVVADDAESGDAESGDNRWSAGGDSGERNRPHRPPKTQVLWGQCGGYYYTGTTLCPDGAYCRYFSDWYSQCNLNGQ